MCCISLVLATANFASELLHSVVRIAHTHTRTCAKHLCCCFVCECALICFTAHSACSHTSAVHLRGVLFAITFYLLLLLLFQFCSPFLCLMGACATPICISIMKCCAYDTPHESHASLAGGSVAALRCLQLCSLLW